MTPDQLTNIIIALIAGLTGSGGCSVILYLLQRRDKKKDGRTEEDKQRDEAMKRQSKLLLEPLNLVLLILLFPVIIQSNLTSGHYLVMR